MAFLRYYFVPNFIDVMQAGCCAFDSALLRAELLAHHRLSKRRFLAEMLPKGGIGAEIGVFTGLFSASLLRITRSRQIYFVDPWWKEFGARYPDWGTYTARGRLPTATAHRVASERIRKHADRTQADILVEHSTTFLPRLPDQHLDWAYLDSTHSYEGTLAELAMLRTKLKPGGMVAGDDWHDSPGHAHSGVGQAVREAVSRGEYELVGSFAALQWAVRLTQTPAAPGLSSDPHPQAEPRPT